MSEWTDSRRLLASAADANEDGDILALDFIGEDPFITLARWNEDCDYWMPVPAYPKPPTKHTNG